jgi:hypothetical protein
MAKKEGKTNTIQIKEQTIGGQKYNSLTMREPLVRDVMLAEKTGGETQADKDIALIANLCDVPVELITGLRYAEYKELASQLKSFL